MKIFFISVMLMSLTLSCSSKNPKEEKGLVFAEKVFDIWKDFSKNQLERDQSEISIKRAELSKNYKMAVYFLPPEAKKQNWQWERHEKDIILISLESQKPSSQIFELINTTGKDNDLKALRYMAAQQGAETLLLIRGTASVNSPMNTKALSYLVILPMLFVEGNNIESTFLTQAVLWDVRTPVVHLGIETEGQWEMQRPIAFKQEARAIEKSKSEAIQSLGHKLKKQLPKIHDV